MANITDNWIGFGDYIGIPTGDSGSYELQWYFIDASGKPFLKRIQPNETFDAKLFVDLGQVTQPVSCTKLMYKYRNQDWSQSGPNPPKVPLPLPFDPKYPTEGPLVFPYGSKIGYRATIMSLEPTLPLRRAYAALLPEIKAGGGLADARSHMEKGDPNEVERQQAAKKIATWVKGNQPSHPLITDLTKALPPGLPGRNEVDSIAKRWWTDTYIPAPGPNPEELSDHEGWLVKSVYALIDAAICV